MVPLSATDNIPIENGAENIADGAVNDALAVPAAFGVEEKFTGNEGSRDNAGEDDDDGEDDDNDDEEEEEDDDDDDDDDDAEAIARRIGDQLWADIQRAKAAAAQATNASVSSPKEEATLSTVKRVLAYVNSDPFVRSTLSSTAVPGFPGSNLLELLSKLLDDGRITKQAARALSQVLVKVAQSEILFAPLPVYLVKRKHDGDFEGPLPPSKRLEIQEEFSHLSRLNQAATSEKLSTAAGSFSDGISGNDERP